MALELDKVVTVRFKAADYRALRHQAVERGETLSDLLRRAALGLPPAPVRRRKPIDQELINQLSRLGNNLNQQTRLFHQLRYRGLLPETAALLDLLEAVRDLLEKVSRAVAERAQ